MGQRLQALIDAAKQFRFYGDNHLAKNTHEGAEKAGVNYNMAERMDKALRMAGDFAIGSDHWPGVGKVIEETGELNTILGKLIATGGHDPEYWGGVNLYEEMEKELGDVLAAIDFLMRHNRDKLRTDVILDRRNGKMKVLQDYHDGYILHDETRHHGFEQPKEPYRIKELKMAEGSPIVTCLWTDGRVDRLSLTDYPGETRETIRSRFENLRATGSATGS